MTDTSKGFNAAGGRLKFIGQTAGALGFLLMIGQNTPAATEPIDGSEQEQVEIERVRLKLGIPANAHVDRHGHLKPAFYMRIDLFDPHVGDEFAAETDEILWFLGASISYTYQDVKWTVPGREWF